MKNNLNPKIKKIQGEHYFWIDITNPGETEKKFLQDNFHFHPLDAEEVIKENQRSKIDRYPNYLFLILHFPLYNKKTHTINSSEADIFIGPDYIITTHKDEMPLFRKIYDLCQLDTATREKTFGSLPEKLLYEMLDKLYGYCFPMLDHLNIELEELEKQIFLGEEKAMTEKILYTRRNIIDFRRIIQPHRKVLQKIVDKNNKDIQPGLFKIQNGLVNFDNLIDNIKEIWEFLESFKESIEGFQNTNESLISHKLSTTMKILTAISVILMPMSIVVNFFTMSVRVPFQHHPYGFVFVTIISIVVGVTFGLYLRFKKWM